MLLSELLSQQVIRGPRGCSAFDPLEREPGAGASVAECIGAWVTVRAGARTHLLGSNSAGAHAQHPRHTHRPGAAKLIQPGRLRHEHVNVPCGCNLHKERSDIALPAVALIDRATVHPGSRPRTQFSANAGSNRNRHRIAHHDRIAPSLIGCDRRRAIADDDFNNPADWHRCGWHAGGHRGNHSPPRLGSHRAGA